MDENDVTPTGANRADRVVDVRRLRALAHPLRTRIFDALAAGPATASGLAELLGESSGLTSYHLRQLAQHGFVEEIAGRGTARERWWQIAPARQLMSGSSLTSPAAKQSLQVFQSEWLRLRYEAAVDYHARAGAGMEPEWQGHSEEVTEMLELTPAETSEMTEELLAVLERWSERTGGRRQEPISGTRPVEVQLRAFPRRAAAGSGSPTDQPAPATTDEHDEEELS